MDIGLNDLSLHIMDVRGLRQYPAGNHDRPLTRLDKRGKIRFRQYEYTAMSNPLGVPRNAGFILQALTVSQGETIVLGAEPYDPRVLLFDRLVDRHNLVLHSSWPFWDDDFAPQPPKIEAQYRWWEEFLNEVTAVCPTESATRALADQGAEAYHIPHSVDTEVFSPDAEASSMADKKTGAGGDKDNKSVLFAGRFERRKGVDGLLSLAEKWVDRPVEFRFAGEGPLASDIDDCRGAKVLGYLDAETLANEYARADLLALPSYRVDGWEELFGVVVIEAFASGTPVVAFDCVGPSELITDGETGYIVPQRDWARLADRIDTILSDTSLRDKMSKAARREAVINYDIEIVADQWLRVLRE